MIEIFKNKWILFVLTILTLQLLDGFILADTIETKAKIIDRYEGYVVCRLDDKSIHKTHSPNICYSDQDSIDVKYNIGAFTKLNGHFRIKEK